MRSTKPIARMFNEEVKKLLNKHRVGVSVSNNPLVDIISDPDKALDLIQGLVKQRKQDKETIEVLEHKVEHKTQIVDAISADALTKRQMINKIVKFKQKADNIPARYVMLGNHFDLTYKKNSKARYNHAVANGKFSGSRIEYICDVMGMADELYKVCVEMFEHSVTEMDLQRIRNNNNLASNELSVI